MFDSSIALVQLREKYASRGYLGLDQGARALEHMKIRRVLDPRYIGDGGVKAMPAVNDTHAAWTGVKAKRPVFLKKDLESSLEGTELPESILNRAPTFADRQRDWQSRQQRLHTDGPGPFHDYKPGSIVGTSLNIPPMPKLPTF